MVKNKFVLTGTDNNGFRHRYSVKKTEEFKKAFSNFMNDLGFEGKKINENLYITSYINEQDEDIQIVLKVADFEDCIRHYQNKDFDVDVFFGRFKIIIVVRTKKRVSMVEHLEKKASWIKASEAKKIREKNKMSWKKISLQNLK